MNTKKTITVQDKYSCSPNSMTFKGRDAQTVEALMAAGDLGITSLEVSSWAFRLSAYIFNLRKEGLTIDTRTEDHDGGSHARYVLRDSLEVVEPQALAA